MALSCARTLGAENALTFSANVTIFVEGPSAATLHFHGMNDLGGDRHSHPSWPEIEDLTDADVLAFRFVESSFVTQPLHEVAADSPEHIAEQAWYEKELQTHPMVPRQVDVLMPNARLEFVYSEEESIVASMEGGREFISLRLLWNKWQPDRCRVSLSSFSQREALAREGGKEWFVGNLQVGQQCSTTIRSGLLNTSPVMALAKP